MRTRSGEFHVRALGPTGPLGAYPFSLARPAIRAALIDIARDQLFDRWLMRRESSALAWTTCARDQLPAIGTLELTSELPFLALTS
jgi:hypothetical protein